MFDLSYSGNFYNVIKSLHIIFVVSYFAGIFYIVRLFIYHTDTQKMDDPKKGILQEEYKRMEKLLWNIITVPAFILMTITGLIMLLSNWNSVFKSLSWMHIKLAFILVLFIYQLICWKIIKELKNNQFKWTSLQLRMWNEVATIILFGVVFAVILKSSFVNNWYWAFGGLIVFSVLIMSIVKLVKKIRG